MHKTLKSLWKLLMKWSEVVLPYNSIVLKLVQNSSKSWQSMWLVRLSFLKDWWNRSEWSSSEQGVADRRIYFWRPKGSIFWNEIKLCDSEEITKIVSSIKSNSDGTDGPNVRTLKSVLPNILPALVFLMNLSRVEGQFSHSLKMAKVIPLSKSGPLSDL